jgi:hypothetical protein
VLVHGQDYEEELMPTDNDASFSEAYRYAAAWYDDISRKELEKEIEVLEKQIEKLGRGYDPPLYATYHAAKDIHHSRFHGQVRDPERDTLPRPGSGSTAPLYLVPIEHLRRDQDMARKSSVKRKENSVCVVISQDRRHPPATIRCDVLLPDKPDKQRIPSGRSVSKRMARQ